MTVEALLRMPSDCLFWRTSGPQSAVQGAVVDAKCARRLGNGVGVPSEGEPDVRSHVVALSAVVSPSAIAWLVVPVDVDAVERVPLGTRAHVFAERREVTQPAVAHSDAPTTIRRVARCPWRQAPPSHIGPDAIQPSVFDRAAMGASQRPHGLPVQASARLRVAPLKRGGENDRSLSAITDAMPGGALSYARRFRLNDKPSKSLPGQLQESRDGRHCGRFLTVLTRGGTQLRSDLAHV